MSTDRTPKARRPLLTVPGASEYGGWSERYTRRLINDRRIAFVKIGGRVFLDPDDIDALIDSSRVEAVR